jgi:hypothetical protein
MTARTLVLLAASVVAFILAAKAHGRQIRLERELEGHHRVFTAAVLAVGLVLFASTRRV